MQLFLFIAVVALFGTPVTYIATHGGVFRRSQTNLSRRERLLLFLQLYGIVYVLYLAYALLIIGGVIDDQFSRRHIPVHFLWAFFGIPILSIIAGKLWYRYRFGKR